MSTSVGQLTIEMAANIARLEKDMRAARKSVDQTMSAIQKSAQAAMNALAAVGGGLSIAGLTAWMRSAIDLNDTINDINKSTGVSIQNLSGLSLASKQSGTDLAGVASAINKLQQNIGKNADQYKLVGITAKDGLEAFKQLSDIFKEIEDPQLRAAFAAEALGKSWQSAAPLLSAGSEEIQNMIDRGNELAKRTPELVIASDDFNDKLAELSASFNGIANQLLELVLPRLTNLLEIFTDLITESPLVESALKGINIVFETVAVLGANVGFVIKTMWNELVMLGDIAVAIAKLDFKNVGEIWNQSKISAQESRAALDAWTESFMKGQTATQKYGQTGDGFNNILKMVNQSLMKGVQEFVKYGDSGGQTRDIYAEMIKKADELVSSLQFETRSLEMSNQERETAIQLRKLEAIGIKEGTVEYEKYAQAIMDTVAINESIKERLKAEEELQKERVKQEEDYAKEVQRINDQIGQSLADALMEGGKSAKDFLIGMFKTMVLRPMLQPIITGIVGTMGFGAAGAAMAGTGGMGGLSGAAGGGMNLMSIGGSIKSAYDMVMGSFTSLGTAVSDLAIEAGFQMLSSGAETAGIAMMESAATLGSVASYLGGIGAGLGLGNLISGGKSIGGSSWISVGGGTAIGAMVGGPIGAAVGGILGGVINAAFGSGAKEYTDSGITGTLTAMVADVEEYSKWKKSGGWFTSTKRGTEFRALNAELQGTLNAALQGIGGSVAYFARSLGQPTDAINSFSQSINISFKDLSEQEIQQKIQEAVSGFESGLIAAVFPSLSVFAYAGESASDTLKRLSDRLAAVNKVFEALGWRLNEISLNGADAANRLIELTGGIESFTQKADFYYQNFYSVQERINKNTDQLTSVFAQLGIALPATRDAFRAIVDVFQQSGATTLLATMLNVAGAFNDYITVVEQTEQQTIELMLARMQEGMTIENRLLQALGQSAELRNREMNALDASNRALQQHVYDLEDAQNAYSSAVDATNQAFEQLRRAISAEQQAIQAASQLANQNLSKLKGLFDFIDDQIQNLVGSSKQTIASGISFIQNSLIAARTTGYLPDQTELSEAINAAKLGLNSSNFITAFEMQRANRLLANDLYALKSIAGDQMTEAEKQIDIAEKQLVSLDAQLSAAQQQIDILNGINVSVLSVAAATNNMAFAMDTQRQATLALAAANQAALVAAQQAAARRDAELAAAKAAADEKARVAEAAAIAAANAAAERARQDEAARQAALAAAAAEAARPKYTEREQQVIALYQEILGRFPDPGGLQWYANESGRSLDAIRKNLLNSPEYRQRAEGGYTSPGMVLVGEDGPELVNFRSPGMVYTSAQTQNLLGGSGGHEIAQEIRSLREDQRIQSKALAGIQLRMTKIIERWEGDGMPSTRYEGATA